jgi:AcrR family transcriptional regulator
MGRDGSATRERLIRAAEQVFAKQGVDEANLRDINRLAEQRNNSALHYHFKSREALAEVVIDRHRQHVTAQRVELVTAMEAQDPAPTSADLVTAIVAPLAAQLLTDSGRDWVQIVLHIRRRGEVRRRGPVSDALSPDLQWIYARLSEALDWLPEELRSERLATMGDMILAALAARAESGETLSAADVDALVINLVDMAVGALEAPSRLLTS